MKTFHHCCAIALLLISATNCSESQIEHKMIFQFLELGETNSSSQTNQLPINDINDATACETYHYDSTLGSGVCQVLNRIDNSNNFFHRIKSCEQDNETCDYLSPYKGSEVINCQPIKNGIPGDPCKYNINCKSNMCILGVCDGKLKNGRCNEDEDCNRGLACVNKKCQMQLPQNSKCKRNNECVNDNGCYNYKCIPYFSLDEGEESQYSIFCKSRFAINGFCREIDLVQENSSTNKDYSCLNPNVGCKYQIRNGGQTFYTNCLCSFGSTTKKYCRMDNSSDFNKLTRKLIENFDLTVHTTRRFEFKRLSISDRKLYEFPKYENLTNDAIKLLSQSSFIVTTAIAFLLILIY